MCGFLGLMPGSGGGFVCRASLEVCLVKKMLRRFVLISPAVCCVSFHLVAL